jgi:hypothetical protein
MLFKVVLAVVAMATAMHAATAGAPADIHCGPGLAPMAGFTPAVVSRKRPPEYPSPSTMRNPGSWGGYKGRDAWSEAWVRASFTVTTDGSVKDVVAVDALALKPFVNATLRALRSWHYKPALRNGVPVEQYGHEVIVEYRLRNSPERAAVHKQFVERYTVATGHIRDKKFAEAIEVLEDALNLRTNRYEAAMASFSLAVAHAQMKNWRTALFHIRHATVFDNTLLEPAVRPSALALRVALEVDDGNYKDAVCVHRDLIEAMPAGDPAAAKIMAQVDAALKNPAPLAVQGRLAANPEIEGPASWMHPLLRAKFHFAQIQGEAKSFRLICTGTVFDAAVDAETEWNVPTAAGECTLRVEGAPGAQFHLVEEW